MIPAGGDAREGAPPYPTGGGGTVLEHRYGAVLLACLLTGDPVPELGDDATPVSVQFQASAVSPVDDFLVVGRTPDGGQRRVSIGVRRAPTLTASDQESAQLLASYLRIVIDNWDEVQAGRWRLCLAVASPNAAVQQLRALAAIARACVDDAAFRAEVARPGRTNRHVRARLPGVDALVAAALAGIGAGDVAAELTWRLLSPLRTRELRLEGADDTDRTHAVGSLRPITEDGTPAAADQLFSRLAELASGYAPAGAVVRRQDLLRDLSGMPLRVSPPAAGPSTAPRLCLGRLVAAWDARNLGVHRAITADPALGEPVPELTTYVPRTHDARARQLLAAPETPLMVVLVGGSSTGKTRAAFEAGRALLPDWLLFRPVDAAELLGCLRSDTVGPVLFCGSMSCRTFSSMSPRWGPRCAACSPTMGPSR